MQRRLLLALVGLLVVMVVSYHLLCSWLKQELTYRAHEILGVEVTLGDVGFSPLSLAVSIEDIEIKRLPFLGDALLIEEALARPDYTALTQRQLRIHELRIIKPTLAASLTIPALPPLGDLTKLKDALKKQARKEKLIDLPQPLRSLTVEEGSLSLSLLIGKATPRTITLSNLRYQNSDLDLISPSTLLRRSSLSFTVGAASIEKTPERFVARGIELAMLTELLSPSDSFRFTAGTLDIEWQNGTAKLSLKGAKLSKALSLLSLNRELDLEFTIPIAADAEAQADIRVIVAELWVGLWSKVVEGASDELKKRLMQEAIKAIKN